MKDKYDMGIFLNNLSNISGYGKQRTELLDQVAYIMELISGEYPVNNKILDSISFEAINYAVDEVQKVDEKVPNLLTSLSLTDIAKPLVDEIVPVRTGTLFF